MSQAATLIRDKRRHFAAPGGAHDRLVRFLAVALPGGVGVIAAVMILTPLSPRGEISFLLDRHKVAITNERVRVSNALYRGEDDQQRPFSVSAGSAVQSDSNVPVIALSDLVARIALSDGPAQLVATGGSYDYAAQKIGVVGPVTFTAADGYRLSATNVAIDLKTRQVTGSNGITGAIPAGTFSAGSIVANLGERSVMLAGNARLHMAPGQLRMP
jgi:lipopolysaccharide export system protein LptC